jgi:uncharacterized Zn finger protein
VQGTPRRPYDVTVELGFHHDGKVTVDGLCSCPVGVNCKHVAALLIETMETPEWRELARPASPSQLSPQVEGWLAELDRALSLGSDAYPPEIRQR